MILEMRHTVLIAELQVIHEGAIRVLHCKIALIGHEVQNCFVMREGLGHGGEES